MAAVTDFAPGLADPVHDAQRVFRGVLEAMARPGTRQRLPALARVPEPLSPAFAAVALTLLDQDVTAWLSPALTGGAVRDHLVFHTGVRMVTTPGAAAFVLCASPGEIPPLVTLSQGTSDYPDRSATVVVDCAQPSSEDVAARLEGPGIETSLHVTLAGFGVELWQQLRENHRAYPLGIDLIACVDDAVVCLPRSTAIEVA